MFLFHYIPVGPTFDRKNLIFREPFCFCSVRVQYGKASVQIDKVGVLEVSESLWLEKWLFLVFSDMTLKCLFGGLSSKWHIQQLVKLRAVTTAWGRFIHKASTSGVTQAVLQEKEKGSYIPFPSLSCTQALMFEGTHNLSVKVTSLHWLQCGPSFLYHGQG